MYSCCLGNYFEENSRNSKVVIEVSRFMSNFVSYNFR